MARVLRSLRQFLGVNNPPPSPSSPSIQRSGPRVARSTIDTDFSHIREGDRIIVFGGNKKRQTPQLTGPLRPGQKFDTPRGGYLKHDELIDRRVRDVVATQKGSKFRISHPTLDQYVALTPRHVTPIYAADANVIVSLLDIHVTPPADGDDNRSPLEILESGTGHGSLTLHLSRAIQAANTLPPPIPKPSQVKYLQNPAVFPRQSTKDTEPEAGEQDQNPTHTQQAWDAWRAQRKAILHTVEVSPTFSTHAERIVRGFHRGIYAGNVDFYVGRVENWIADQINKRSQSTSTSTSTSPATAIIEPFLTHAILDMPSAHLRIPHVAPVLKTNGILAVFMPSVTQIADCVELIKKERIPLDLDQVIELGTGISGGRLWDVRVAMKKSKADPNWEAAASSSSEAVAESGSGSGSEAEFEPASEESSGDSEEGQQQPQILAAASGPSEAIVCRPKAGMMTAGGGFVGIWRKIQGHSGDASSTPPPTPAP
ncbi:tRNA (adenine-N(1)-)-methyltransferase [Aspergillus undulatus]|uniref:tRNA (adenine-N(1)-)-methyltransferase n=1 Tax=Aspergillus undulatus TaxID=1810928 RepID=UPI003CCDD6AA